MDTIYAKSLVRGPREANQVVEDFAVMSAHRDPLTRAPLSGLSTEAAKTAGQATRQGKGFAWNVHTAADAYKTEQIQLFGVTERIERSSLDLGFRTTVTYEFRGLVKRADIEPDQYLKVLKQNGETWHLFREAKTSDDIVRMFEREKEQLEKYVGLISSFAGDGKTAKVQFLVKGQLQENYRQEILARGFDLVQVLA